MALFSETSNKQTILHHSIDTTIIKAKQANGSILFLHGAGESTKHRTIPLARSFAKLGYSSLSFSFPGHGDSSGKLHESSLEERLSIARAIADANGFLGATMCIGVSMGAHIATQLACEETHFEKLVLLVPAAYAKDAQHVAFGVSFTDIIRTKDSYISSHLWENLKKFTGQLITIETELDTVIPKKVIDLYHESTTQRPTKRIRISDAPHRITTWLHENNHLDSFASAIHTNNFSNIAIATELE